MYTKQEIFDKTLSSYYSKLPKEEIAKVRIIIHDFLTAIDTAIVKASDEGHFTAYSSLATSKFNHDYQVKICIQEVYAYYIKLGFNVKVKRETDDTGSYRICVTISWDYV